MSEICYINSLCYPYIFHTICTNYKPEENPAKIDIVLSVHVTNTLSLKLIHVTKTFHIFEHFRNEMDILQNRLVQFTDKEKKAKKAVHDNSKRIAKFSGLSKRWLTI